MKLVITNLPAFYKIELYNRVNRICPLTVVYTGADSYSRNKDFYHGVMEFENHILKGNILTKTCQLRKILKSRNYDEIIIGGWDSVCYWATAFMSSPTKNAVIVESSDFESKTKGVTATIKRVFISRLNKAYCSGHPHARLMRKLGFKKKIVITKGVGVFHYHEQPTYSPRKYVKNFLFVGRLVEVKNLQFLIHKFNGHPELNLHIIGFGEQDGELKAIAKDNVRFYGAVDNTKLAKYYQNFDVFILPSLSEPWGLVVEEALNNGMPVLVSDFVGCHEDVVNENTGLVFSLQDDEDFEKKLAYICNIDNYNRMRHQISLLDYESIENAQVQCYL